MRRLYLNRDFSDCKWQKPESNQFKQTRNLLAHITSSLRFASLCELVSFCPSSQVSCKKHDWGGTILELKIDPAAEIKSSWSNRNLANAHLSLKMEHAALKEGGKRKPASVPSCVPGSGHTFLRVIITRSLLVEWLSPILQRKKPRLKEVGWMVNFTVTEVGLPPKPLCLESSCSPGRGH